MNPRTHIVGITYFLILFAAATWDGAILAAPVFIGMSGPVHVSGEFLYTLFQPVCHQLDGRSLHLLGFPLGVCSRCSAIYFGFLFSTLLYPLVRSLKNATVPSRPFIVLAILPMLVDVAAGMTGLHEVSYATRIITGTFFGLAAPFVIVPVLIQAACEWFSSSPITNNPGVTHASET